MLKRIVFSAAAALFVLSAFFTGCEKWTEPEAKEFLVPEPSEEYKQNIKDYLNSPHKVMFGWFGSQNAWSGKTSGVKGGSLMGLPDSLDFVSLWLQWGPWNEAQIADLKEFQASGRRAVLCWRCGSIGDNLTPSEWKGKEDEFWGYTRGDWSTYVPAAEKYAMAIVDSCRRHGFDGFDYDCEDSGTLFSPQHPEVVGAFLMKLYEEFEKDGRWLVIDIPEPTWSGYTTIPDDALLAAKYIAWQTYQREDCTSVANSILNIRPTVGAEVLKKSIFTCSFEQANYEVHWNGLVNWGATTNIEFGGCGVYHIEMDFASSAGQDYPRIRSAISKLNRPVVE